MIASLIIVLSLAAVWVVGGLAIIELDWLTELWWVLISLAILWGIASGAVAKLLLGWGARRKKMRPKVASPFLLPVAVASVLGSGAAGVSAIYWLTLGAPSEERAPLEKEWDIASLQKLEREPLDRESTAAKATSQEQLVKMSEPRRWEPQDLESVQRYPTVEAPTQVKAGVEFAVQVAMTEDLLAPEVEPDPVNLLLPINRTVWNIEVALSGRGFTFRDGRNADTIRLPSEGDSTWARFYLTANEVGDAVRPLWVTFYYDSRFLHRARRLVNVAPSVDEPSGGIASGAPGIAIEPAAFGALEEGAQPTSFSLVPGPDLTIEIIGDRVRARGKNLALFEDQYKPPKRDELTSYLSVSYARLVSSAGRGVKVVDPQGTVETTRGIGRELYQQFAPDLFKEAFWFQVDRLGDEFDSIQIYSDDPQLPWELMVPFRENGTEERNHLGVEFSISRWHARQDSRAVSSPPPIVDLKELVLVAPRYTPPLPEVEYELDTIKGLNLARRLRVLRGGIDDVRASLSSLPQGIVHFAGHGVVRGGAPGSEYAILLGGEQELSLKQWKGMIALQQTHHPFIFFNACDVGRAARTVGFVNGWAPVMLDAGASGYLGALWPVSDAKAAQFAMHFYRSLATSLAATSEANIMEAVKSARSLFFESGDPTYLAYVYYGDPALTIRTTPP